MAWLELWTEGDRMEGRQNQTDNEILCWGRPKKNQDWNQDTQNQKSREARGKWGRSDLNIDMEWGIVSWEDDESGPYLRSVSKDW